MKPVVSIIYVYYATPQELLTSIASLKEACGKLPYEIIIIDNLSPVPLPKQVQSNPKIHLMRNAENKGYGKALNQGAKIARGTFLLLVNPDTVFLQNSIANLVEKLKQDSSIGVIGPQFLDADNHVGVTGNGLPTLPQALFAFSFLQKIFPNNPYSNSYFLKGFDRTQEKDIPVICGACMLIRKSIFESIHGFDEQFFLYFEESDLCYRVTKQGLRVLYYPKAKVIHYGGRSSSNTTWIKKHFEESRYKFFKKYHTQIIAFLGESLLRFLNNFSNVKYPLLLLLLTFVFYHKIFLSPNEMINASDIIGAYAPEKWFFSYSIKTLHSFPLWNPYLFSGTPFPGNPTTAIFYPINLLYLLFNSNVAFGYVYVLDVYLISLFTYLFARTIHLERFAAFITAVIFAFSATIAVRIIPGHVFFLDNLVWFPLLLLFFEKIIQKQKIVYGVFAAVPIANMFLSGFIQIAFYSLFTASLYIGLRFFLEMKNHIRNLQFKNVFFSFLIANVLGFSLGAVQILPTLEFAKQSLRTNGLPYEIATTFSLHPFQIISFIFPHFFGSQGYFWGKGNFHEMAAYIGIIPLLLVLLALVKKRTIYIGIFSFLIVLSLAYALGKYSPVFFLFYRFIPGFNSFRVPVRMLFVYTFSLSILAGFGVHYITKKTSANYHFLFIGFFSLIVSTILLLNKNSLYFYMSFILQNKYASNYPKEILFGYFLRDLWIFSLSLLAFSLFLYVLKKYPQRREEIKILITVCIVLDLYVYSYGFVDMKSISYIFQPPPIIKKITADSGKFRTFDLTERIFPVLPDNHIEGTIGVNSMRLKEYNDFFSNAGDHENWPYESFFQFKHTIKNLQILDILNVKYIISDTQLPVDGLSQIDASNTLPKNIVLEAGITNHTLYLYKNSHVLPRAYIVSNARVIKNEEKTLSVVTDKTFQPKEYVILNSIPSIPLRNKQTDEKVTIVSYSPNTIKVSLQLQNPGFLVLSELWYPGWKAYDNGKELPIYRADFLLRSVSLPKGNHIILWQYDPVSFKVGASISLLSLSIIGAYSIVTVGKGKIKWPPALR